MDDLLPKQKKFVKEYLDNGGNATQAIIDAKYNVKDRSVARSMGAENLAKPSIQAVIESHAEKAESMVYHLSQNGEAEAIRLNASKDILDRAGYKAIDKSINLNIEAEITNPKARELAEKYEEELKKNL